MNILAIETSCDETAIAILKCSGNLKDGLNFKILANEVSSQIKIHRPFGGVVPNLAKREHIKNLPKIYRKIKKEIPGLEKKIDLIAVTIGPGLEPALWAGITFAEKLAKKIEKPLIGVNHLEGHLYSFLLKQQTTGDQQLATKLKFPAIGLLVSGGHTIILKMQSLVKWEKLGETVDDAVGEAFDKVAKMLGLSYPGGPEVEKLAKQGNPKAINFPRPMLNQKNYDFSFSGLKTSVLYYLRDTEQENNLCLNPLRSSSDSLASPRRIAARKKTQRADHANATAEVSDKDCFSVQQLADIAASFQQAAIDVLTKKTMRAAEEFFAKSVIICGGVACNKTLRETVKREVEKRNLSFIAPEMQFNTDNAAMMAVAAYIHSLAKKKIYKIEADSNLNL